VANPGRDGLNHPRSSLAILGRPTPNVDPVSVCASGQRAVSQLTTQAHAAPRYDWSERNSRDPLHHTKLIEHRTERVESGWRSARNPPDSRSRTDPLSPRGAWYMNQANGGCQPFLAQFPAQLADSKRHGEWAPITFSTGGRFADVTSHVMRFFVFLHPSIVKG